MQNVDFCVERWQIASLVYCTHNAYMVGQKRSHCIWMFTSLTRLDRFAHLRHTSMPWPFSSRIRFPTCLFVFNCSKPCHLLWTTVCNTVVQRRLLLRMRRFNCVFWRQLPAKLLLWSLLNVICLERWSEFRQRHIDRRQRQFLPRSLSSDLLTTAQHQYARGIDRGVYVYDKENKRDICIALYNVCDVFNVF